MGLPFKRHSSQAVAFSKDRYGPYGFLRILHARYVHVWVVHQFMFWCGVVATIGAFFHHLFHHATALASTAATGVTFLGSWATLAYLCRGLKGCLELVPYDSPAAIANGYIMGLLYPHVPATPIASPVDLDFLLDPRHATAIMGTLVSIFGCFKHG